MEGTHRPRLDCLIWFPRFLFFLYVLFFYVFSFFFFVFFFFFLFSSYSFFSLIWPAVFLSFSVLSRPLASPARHQLEATSLTFHNLETFEKYIAHTRCRHKDEWNASLALRPVRIPLFFSKLLQSLYHWKVKAFSSFFSCFFLPSFSSW
jgi:hypothetical protein